MSLLGLILANIAAEAFTLVVQRRYYFRLYRNGRPGWGIRDWTLFFSMIRFGLGYLLVIVGGRLTMNTDNLVVGKLYGAVEASIYYTTQIPAFLLMGLTWKIADNAAPAMNELFARKENDRLRQSYARLLRYSLLIAVGLAFGLMAFNRTIITLWVGQGQYAGRPMTIALGLFIIFAVANHVNSLILVVHGSVKWLSALSLAGGITNLLLSLWLGRVAGLAGVMIASAVVEFIVMVPLAAKGLKLIRLSFTDLWHQTIVPAVAANVFVLPVVALAHSWRMSLTWPSLVLWSLIFVAVWMIGVAKAGLNEVDIRPLHNYFGRMFSFGR
jgi:O-antigen/teichoic acid export membrane protein